MLLEYKIFFLAGISRTAIRSASKQMKKTDNAGLIQNLASENGTILLALDHARQSRHVT
jgi:hypothetical protein